MNKRQILFSLSVGCGLILSSQAMIEFIPEVKSTLWLGLAMIALASFNAGWQMLTVKGR